MFLVPFLYLASLRNSGGASTGGYGYGYGYQQQRKFNIFNPLMPKIESQWYTFVSSKIFQNDILGEIRRLRLRKEILLFGNRLSFWRPGTTRILINSQVRRSDNWQN